MHDRTESSGEQACLIHQSIDIAVWKQLASTDNLSATEGALVVLAAVLERLFEEPVLIACTHPYRTLTLRTAGRSLRDAAREVIDAPVDFFPERPSVRLRPPDGATQGALLIDPASIPLERACSLARAFHDLLRLAVRNPEALLDTLPIAATYDRAGNWDCPEPPEHCAMADRPADMAFLFAAITGRWPDAPAIVWPQGRLSFAELDRAADAIAGVLRRRGVTQADTVAVRVAADAPNGSSVLYLCAQIAAFRLSCAVMPLGQQVPQAQAWAQMERVGARFVLSATTMPTAPPAWLAEANADSVPNFPNATLFSRTGAARPLGHAGARRPAVILTSSGTTGTPKTICLSQAMILGFLRGLQAAGSFVPCPALINANIGFDIILADVWIPWMYGHHVVVLETDRRTPAVLAAARSLGAQFTSFSPSVATVLLNQEPDCLALFKGLHVAGEALPLAVARRLETLAPNTRVVNGYGPSETAPLATVWPVVTENEAAIPIGHALPGYRVLIADHALRPLPAHWPGEILIAPAASALGYHDSAMSAGVFQELPGEAPGPFFRTGDYGWIDSQGRVQFIGRRDRQIKLRGVRIELNEVEGRILTVPGVSDAAVIPRAAAATVDGLLAIVQPGPGQAADAAFADCIIAACRTWLPRAAVPARVIFVDTIPKGPSGKKAYGILIGQHHQGAQAPPARTLPPAGSIEARLAALWQETLGANGAAAVTLCAEDDVFAFGATSLDALTMAERIEAVFGVKVADDQMFMHATIGGQAAMIRTTSLASPTIARTRLSLRLLRAADAAVPSRGIILGLPGIGGTAPYLGSVAAHALHDFDIWTASVALEGLSLLDGNAWLDCARLIADALRTGNQAPRAMIGFSLGGFLGWLVDRMLTRDGIGGIPIVNLDGGVPDRELPNWHHVAAACLPSPGATPAARMLLLRQGRLPGFAARAPHEQAWAALGVAVRTRCIATVCHLDFNRPTILMNEADALATFAETGACEPVPDESAPDADTSGGMVFRLLKRCDTITRSEIAALLHALPPGPVDGDLRLGITFLALAAGDPSLASAIIERLVAEKPDLRNETYALVALLAQTGRTEEALAHAHAWAAHHGPDPRMLARAVRSIPPCPDLSTVFRLFTDGAVEAIDAASSRLVRAGQHQAANAG